MQSGCHLQTAKKGFDSKNGVKILNLLASSYGSQTSNPNLSVHFSLTDLFNMVLKTSL